MAAFAVISPKPDAVLANTISEKYRDRHYVVSESAWFVADTNKTTHEVCETLNIKAGGSQAIVVKTDGYFGFAPPTLWEWLKVKGAGL